MVDEFYRTAQRPKAARSGAVNPRPGEDEDRGGQKTYVPDPDGMKATDPGALANDIPAKERLQKGADFHQPVRGNEPPDGEGAGDPVLRGEKRKAQKSNA